MTPVVEIDQGSGFCFGVTTAIKKAEATLATGEELYCLGDIVHNGKEVERLGAKGLKTVTHAELGEIGRSKVLLRAHGEPPETYRTAEKHGIDIIDATCPVVLQLQKRIRRQHEAHPDAQIAIFGKRGHAEVLGLVGQTGGKAIVVESIADAEECLDMGRDIYLYSQTTMSLDKFRQITAHISGRMGAAAHFESFDTICRQVANRMPHIARFAAAHEAVVFVSGRKSSNGKALFGVCKKANPNSHHVESPGEIESGWVCGAATVGICGATSTPKWLMEQCRDRIYSLTGQV